VDIPFKEGIGGEREGDFMDNFILLLPSGNYFCYSSICNMDLIIPQTNELILCNLFWLYNGE
jgi:hypothetical protein